MSEGQIAETAGLALRSRRDGALDEALQRLAPGPLPERPDTPDLHVTALRRLPAVPARFAPFPGALDQRLRDALTSRGITELYTHQAQAIGHALDGRNVVVITPTASGKTLCYNAPVLHSILQDPASRALYLFPTKALAQDQVAELLELNKAGNLGLRPATFDGDTPGDQRQAIRLNGDIVVSNPDMLHQGILPHTPSGRSSSKHCSTSSSTRSTAIAGCSARTWPTCCGG